MKKFDYKVWTIIGLIVVLLFFIIRGEFRKNKLDGKVQDSEFAIRQLKEKNKSDSLKVLALNDSANFLKNKNKDLSLLINLSQERIARLKGDLLKEHDRVIQLSDQASCEFFFKETSVDTNQDIEYLIRSQDTLPIVPIPNIRVANIKFVEFNSIKMQLESSVDLNSMLGSQVHNYNLLLLNREQVISLKDSTITNLNKETSLIRDEKKIIEKKLRREKTKFIIALVGAGVLAVVAIIK